MVPLPALVNVVDFFVVQHLVPLELHRIHSKSLGPGQFHPLRRHHNSSPVRVDVELWAPLQANVGEGTDLDHILLSQIDRCRHED